MDECFFSDVEVPPLQVITGQNLFIITSETKDIEYFQGTRREKIMKNKRNLGNTLVAFI